MRCLNGKLTHIETTTTILKITMKLKSALFGIMALLMLWMAVSFIRPVPLASYEQYVAELPSTSENASAQTASIEAEEEGTIAVD